MPSRCDILPGDEPASITRAAEVLRDGGIVGMPTETVYGLAANALDPAAVAKVFEAKERPSFDPLIVHVPSLERAAELAEFNVLANRLAQAFWPGPLTLVLPRHHDTSGLPIVPDLVTAGLDSVGLRMPAHPVAQVLLHASGLVLAAPSANRFGSISPTTAQHVVEELGDRIDLVLDGGTCTRGLESTVVRVQSKRVEVLRLGALPVEQIEEVVGSVEVKPPSSSPGRSAKPSPGMVDRHYAPRTKMLYVATLEELNALEKAGRMGLIGFGELPGDLQGFAVIRNLSKDDLSEAAAGLFQTLRELDAMGLERIVAMALPDVGLGRAINDRLKRGSAR